MTITSTLWPLEPHTRGKHLVLKSYLEAWFPKLGFQSQKILFIDGFAGPGEYERGEKGSPLIALDTFLEHSAREAIGSAASFVFIEKDKRRCQHLKSLVESYRTRLPSGWTIEVICAAFDATLTTILDLLDRQQRELAPTVVMIDPFGVSDTPLELVARIMRNRKAEVYISFMYEAINRWKSTPEFSAPLDQLFGCREWREGLKVQGSEERKDFFFDLYTRQLRSAGAHHVVHFDLYEGERLVYGLFFGTHHWKGADVMKSAVWKIAPFGDFRFRGTRSPQLTLGLTNPDFRPLREVLQRRYAGRDWVEVKSIERFVGSDETDYHVGQLRKHALKPMEASGEIEVDPSSRLRTGTYPGEARIRFR